jgi:hypothetical protein
MIPPPTELAIPATAAMVPVIDMGYNACMTNILLGERYNCITRKSDPIEVNFALRTVRLIPDNDPLAAKARSFRRAIEKIDWENGTAELRLYGVAQDFEKESIKSAKKYCSS